MRLNLGEIALCLGCAPGMVIWDGPPAPFSQHIDFARPILTMKDLSQRRAASLLAREKDESRFIERSSWSGIVPTGAQVDSRQVQPGNLFFCLPGEKADGHDFAPDAAIAGASAIIASRNPFLSRDGKDRSDEIVPPPVFLVEDPRRALWRLAMCHRDTSLAKVIGITGTAGKTSVKEVLAQVLSVRGRTERNPVNMNNQIGMPVSMLNSSADASFWVLEVGISEAHDMRELGAILRPDVAVILNVGDAHMIGLADIGVAAHKARLLDFILPGGAAIVSADYPQLNEELDKRAGALDMRGIERIRFSTSLSATCCHAAYDGVSADFSGRYRVFSGGREYLIECPFRGDFGSENVAAIFAAAVKLGLGNAEIARGFSSARLPAQRFACRRYGNFMLVDDSYNSNPLSALRMLKASRSMADESSLPLILVMAEMLELGETSGESHRKLGQAMAEVMPELVFWKGGNKERVLCGLREAGYKGLFYHVGGGQDFSLLLEELELKRGLFLFKGSRGNQLERLVDIFRETASAAGRANAV